MDDNGKHIKILCVEDLESDYELAMRTLKKENINFTSIRVDTEVEMLKALATFSPDLIISDYSMPQFDGRRALQITLDNCPQIPFIMLTGSMNEETAVECMKAGATDYVIKERMKRLPFAVNEALMQARTLEAKRKAERALIKSEERFRRLAENAQDLIFRFEYLPERRFAYISPSSTHLTGYTPQEHYNDPDLWQKLVHPYDLDTFNNLGIDISQLDKPVILRWVHKSGRTIWTEQKNVYIFNKEDELIAIEGVVRDITERKLAEEALSESEKKYRLITESASDVVWTCDLNLKLTYVSPSAEKLFGYSVEEHKERTLEHKHPPSSIKLLKSSLALELENESNPKYSKDRSQLLEIEHFRADGSAIWTEIKISFLRNDVGKVIGLQGVTRDISKRKRAELELKESEERYRNIYENATIGIYRTTPDGEILMANPSLVKMLGFSTFEELQQQKINEVNFGQSYSRNDFLNRIESEGVVKGFESAWKLHNGQTIYVVESARVVYGRNREVLYYEGVVEDITERKTAEESIRESQQMAQATLDSISANICVIDDSGCILSVNKSWIEFASNNAENWNNFGVGSNYFAACKNATEPDKDAATQFLWGIHLVLRGDTESFEMEYECHSPTEKRWFVARVTQFNSGASKHKRVVVAHENITQQKKAEISARASEERYSTFMNSSTDIAYIKDESLHYVMINAAGVKTLKKKEEEIIGRTDFEILKYEHAHNSSLSDKEAIEKGRLVVNVETIDDKTFETRKFPVKLPIGNIGVGCFIRDITDRHMAQKAILESELKYRNLVENALIGVYSTNIKGDFLFANMALCQILEFDSPFDLMKTNVKSFYKNNSDRDNFIEQLKVKDKLTNYEIEMITHKGNIKYVTLSASVTGNIITGMLMDMTDRRVAEQELLAKQYEIETQNEEYRILNEELALAMRRAEESDRLKTAFLQNLSHEIRTPMNGIVGFTHLLKEKKSDPELSSHYIDIIEKSSDRLMSLISDLVDISKIETGQIVLDLVEFDLNSMLQELQTIFSNQADEKGLVVTLGHQLSDNEKDIVSDQVKVFQVLSNLLKNALKFTNSGTIEFGCKRKGDFIEFYVSDTGIGIYPNKQNIIFDRFVQAETSISRGYEGAGLGLSISKAFVEKLGGTIWVSSQYSVGSTFFFTIPYRNAK
jgi:PAS domain S-box-containing protein